MTEEQRAVLAHVVIDPDAWYDHAISVFGRQKARECLVEKVDRWRPSYEDALAQEGAGYRARAEREAQ